MMSFIDMIIMCHTTARLIIIGITTNVNMSANIL
jgi:hypothetical protein